MSQYKAHREDSESGDVNADVGAEGPIDPDRTGHRLSEYTNLEDLRKMYRMLGHERETEVCILDARGERAPIIVFVHGADEFVQLCNVHNQDHDIFVGVNERTQWGTEWDSVVRVDAIKLAIDPLRKGGWLTMDEHLRAREVAFEVLNFLRWSGHRPSLAVVDGGYDIYLRTRIPVTCDNRHQVKSAIAEFQRSIALRFFDGVRARLDVQGDLATVGRAVGTMCLGPKSCIGSKSRWMVEPDDSIDQALSAQIIADASTKGMAVIEDAQEPAARTSCEQESEDWLDRLCRLDEKTRSLFDGAWWHYSYRSRFEGELALVCRLACAGVPETEVCEIMDAAKIGRWNLMGEKYQSRIIDRAYGFVESISEGDE